MDKDEFTELIREDRHQDHRPRPSPEGRTRTSLNGIWLTVEETVRYLGLPSRRALYQAVRRGQVPVHRLGRRLRFRRAELDDTLNDR